MEDPSSITVCVTGANGFVASYIVQYLLEKGYNVRGTVRSLGDTRRFQHLLKMPNQVDRLRLYAANLTEDHSFDEAINGCQYVIHTASPYILNVSDPQRDLVDPAVKGTHNVLNSCIKYNIRKVVLTSSVAAITDSPTNGHVYTEKDWNTASSLNRNPYYFSKTVAEKAAWDFAKTNKIDLVVINPFVVVGPEFEGQRVNPSNTVFRDMLNGQWPGILSLSWGMVDVRDVARAHILAMENPKAEGRYILWHETWNMRQCCDVVRRQFSEYPVPTVNLATPIGNTIVYLASYLQPAGTGQYIRTNLKKHPVLDHSKISSLGLEFIPTETTIIDTCNNLIQRGQVPKPGSVKPRRRGVIVLLILLLVIAPAWVYYYLLRSH